MARTRRHRVLAKITLAASLTVPLAAALALATQPATDAPPRFRLEPGDSPAVEHRIRLRSGAELIGVITERGDAEVSIRSGEKPAVVPTSQIASIEALEPLDQRYAARRSQIEDTDAAALVLLAEWLRDRGAYRTALREARLALEADPLSPEGRGLVRWLEAQVALVDAAARRREDDGDEATAAPTARFPRLTPQEVNAIRVWEVDLAARPEVVIPRSTAEEFLEAYAGTELVPEDERQRAELLKRPPHELLELMFRLRAREFYGSARVVEDPPALARFRESTHRRWLMNSCATSRCHGGAEAGRLRLANTAPNSDQTVYTNFYILLNATLADGTPLIDFQEPGASPLLQLGLPRELSANPHPRVIGPGVRARGWRPVFRSDKDTRYADAVSWIRSLYQPRPDYGISYELPPVDEPEPARPRVDR